MRRERICQWLLPCVLLLSVVSCAKDKDKGNPPRATSLNELYGLQKVPTFDLFLSDNDLKALRERPKKWRKGKFEYEGATYPRVAIRIKGHRSLRSIDDKPALKLRFNKGKAHKGRRFLGVHRLTLNNLVEDPTMIREYLAYRLARELGLPVPKAGYVNLRVNGESYGLYLVVETPDKDFLKRRFGSKGGELYEGEYGCDLFVDDVQGFEQDVGTEDRSQLTRFAQAADEGNAVWAGAAAPMKLQHLSMFLAFSNYVGDFDGYQHSHNYRIYRNPIDNQWQMMSWGLDRSFFKSLAPYSSRGLLAKRCFADNECRLAYLQNLRRVHKAATKLDLATGAKVISAVISTSVNADERRPYKASAIKRARKKLLQFVSTRESYVREATRCLGSDGAEVDADGDGFACMDCDDLSAEIHPGASEACDGLDNNCSGLVDDDPSCVCPSATISGERFLFCNLPMPWSESAAHCRLLGGELASIQSVAQLESVREIALGHDKSRWWLGGSDRKEESVFVWEDGTPIAPELWGKGEPDNSTCNQDCSILHDKKKGRLHDTHCGQHRPFICKLPES